MPLQNKSNKIIIGTANMGDMHYGFRKKRVKRPKILIQHAIKNKIFLFDTAYTYNSEQNLQNVNSKVKIFSKTIQITEKLKKLKIRKIKDLILNSIESSIERSPKKKIYCMYIHRVEDFFYHGKIILKILKYKKSKRKLSHIGISLNHFKNLKIILLNPEIKYIQIPVNIFDKRWKKVFKNKKLIRGKKFIARSIFLQGLIFKSKNLWPKSIKKFYPVIKKILNNIQSKFPDRSLDEIFYVYVNSIDKFDKIISGVSKKADIDKILKYKFQRKFNKNELNFIENQTKNIPKIFYIPAYWEN